MRTPIRFLLACGLLAPATTSAGATAIALASRADDPVAVGTEPAGDASGCALSSDGSRVAFVSTAFNLVPGDRNRRRDAFVRDRAAGTLQRVTGPGGVELAAQIDRVVLSGDGAWLVLETADPLVPEDTNTLGDVYLQDRATGALTLLSRTPAGVAGNGSSSNAAISETGTFVAFQSTATDLLGVPLSTPTTNVYRFSRVALSLDLVSRRRPGLPVGSGDGASTTPRISAAGRYVGFTSSATDLVNGDTNNAQDVFVRDFATGTTDRASLDAAGAQITRSSRLLDLGSDGRVVLLETDAALDAGDSNALEDVYRRRLDTGSVSWASRTATGAARSTGQIADGRMSGSGGVVAFSSDAIDLVAGDTGQGLQGLDVFVQRGTAALARLSNVAGLAGSANGDSSGACVSADGATVGFASVAGNLVVGDLNAASDVVVCDPAACAPQRVGTADVAVPVAAGAFGAVKSAGGTLGLSRDGGTVLFASESFNLDLADTVFDDGRSIDLYTRSAPFADAGQVPRTRLVSPGVRRATSPGAMSGDARYVVFPMLGFVPPVEFEHLVWYDTVADVVLMASGPNAGVGFDGHSREPRISLDGEWVVFTTTAPAPGVADGNGARDVLRWRRSTGTTDVVSVVPGGAATGDFESYAPSVSDDGRYVAFVSRATNLVAGDPNGSLHADVFVRDLQTGTTTRVSRTTGAVENGPSTDAQISGDGSCVTFRSVSSLLPANEPDVPGPGVFAWVRATGVIETLGRRPDGAIAQAADSFRVPVPGSDCRYVAYFADLDNVAPPGGGTSVDTTLVQRFDRVTRAVSVMNLDAAGGWLAFDDLALTSQLALSDDGRSVAFITGDPAPLDAIDLNAWPDVVVLRVDAPAAGDTLFADGFETAP